MKSKLIAKVRSVSELSMLARSDDRYARLAIVSANNLGGDAKSVDDAIRWLYTNASEVSEEGVIDEVNFCRDLVGA